MRTRLPSGTFTRPVSPVTLPLATVRAMFTCALSLATPDATDVGVGARLGDGTGGAAPSSLLPPHPVNAVAATRTGTSRAERCTAKSCHEGTHAICCGVYGPG